MLKTLKFPLQIDPATGSLAVRQGLEAAAQTLEAWGVTEPGELLYFGGYGTNLSHNIPRTLAEEKALEMRLKALSDHPWLRDAAVRLVPDPDTRTVRAVLAYEVGGEQGVVGFEVGG